MSAFIHSFAFARIKNLVIGFAAAVVMIGALFKILSWDGANEMLMVGLITEAGIFLLLGVLPPHKDYHWEKLYPDLDVAPEMEIEEKGLASQLNAKKGSVTEQLNTMLEKSVQPELIEKLGDNLRKLGVSIEQMSDMQDAAKSTSDYTLKTKEAANALSEMKVAYSNAAGAMRQLGEVGTDSVKYHEQVQAVTKNLSQLNAIYELELQDTNNHLKAMNKFYGGLATAMDNLNESIEDSMKYKTEIASLANNLSQLNNVYGNMLSAMTISRPQPAKV
ncbi:MAG: gliding motility protein GldL [Bacteroidetes bacterium]|nr:gliding motility protein GldL [Bacteroidota bacterium]